MHWRHGQKCNEIHGLVKSKLDESRQLWLDYDEEPQIGDTQFLQARRDIWLLFGSPAGQWVAWSWIHPLVGQRLHKTECELGKTFA